MTKHISLEAAIRSVLQPDFTFQKVQIGKDARLSAKGIVLETDVYDVAGLGHLCVLRMRGFLGLMKMETVVLSVTEKEVPLLNLDWVRAFGKETQVIELYETGAVGETGAVWETGDGSVSPEGDAEPSPVSQTAPVFSYKDSGRNRTACYNQVVADFLNDFAERMKEADACDPEQKKEQIRSFANALFTQGGPAVDQVKRLFGEETAGRLILQYMYGTEEEKERC